MATKKKTTTKNRRRPASTAALRPTTLRLLPEEYKMVDDLADYHALGGDERGSFRAVVRFCLKRCHREIVEARRRK